MTKNRRGLDEHFDRKWSLFQSRLLDAVHQSVIVADLDGQVIYWNKASEELHGWTREEALGKRAMHLLFAGAIDEEMERLERTVRQGTPWAGESRLCRKDGSTFPAMCTVSPIRNRDGEMMAILKITTDLTRTKKTELALRERVKELRTLYRASHLMNRHDIAVEERLRELVEIIPAGWLYPDITRAQIVLGETTVRNDGFRETPWMLSAAIRLRHGANGRIDVALLEARPVRDEGPFLSEERNLIDSLARTIGEAVERSRLTRLLEQTFSSLDEAVVISSSREDGRKMIDCNPATERIFGYSREELLGSTSEKVHVDRDAFERFAEEAAPVLEETGVFTATYPMRRKDGTIFAAEQTLTMLDPELGLDGGVVNVVRDVSGRVELEEKLRQSQKMEAIGRLAGGIAHDFNNLLTVIQVQTDLMLMDHEASSEIARDLQLIRETTERAGQLTDQLLAFSRDQVLEPRRVDANAVVRATARMLTRIIGEDIDLGLDLDPRLPAVETDPAQLQQVILNLAVNARDAMPDGGAISIVTTSEKVTDEADVEPGEYAVLRVTDTGTGIPPESLPKIFEPFFSTKGPGKGTGLGLSMAYGFIRQSGGTIRVDSERGQGTSFELLFPAFSGDSHAPEEKPTPRSKTDDTGAGLIWLVEDSPDVRRVASRFLQRHGYTVEAFEDAESALAAAESGAEFDLVLTDLVFPGLSGPELVRRLRESRPSLQVIAMSGYSEGDADRRLLPPDVEFVRKPFSPAHLLDAVRRALV